MGLFNLARLFVEYRDKFVADNLSFRFRIDNAGKFGEKALSRIHRDQMQPKFLAEALLDFFEFILAQHAVVHEHAGQERLVAVAHGAITKYRSRTGIHSANTLAS